MLFKSPVYSQASGSIAGIVYSHNRFGMYTRARSLPTNPNTSRQQAVRAALGDLAQHWANTLTAAQRADWEAYAAQVTMLNKLGDPVYLTGFQHYIRSNTVILQCGLTRVDAGPNVLSLPGTDPTAAASFSEAAGVLSIAFDTNLEWVSEDNAAFAVLQGIAYPGAAGYVNGPSRFADSIDGDSITPPTSPQTFEESYPIVEGQKVRCQFRIIRADGRVSMPFWSTFTAAA